MPYVISCLDVCYYMKDLFIPFLHFFFQELLSLQIAEELETGKIFRPVECPSCFAVTADENEYQIQYRNCSHHICYDCFQSNISSVMITSKVIFASRVHLFLSTTAIFIGFVSVLHGKLIKELKCYDNYNQLISSFSPF